MEGNGAREDGDAGAERHDPAGLAAFGDAVHQDVAETDEKGNEYGDEAVTDAGSGGYSDVVHEVLLGGASLNFEGSIRRFFGLTFVSPYPIPALDLENAGGATRGV